MLRIHLFSVFTIKTTHYASKTWRHWQMYCNYNLMRGVLGACGCSLNSITLKSIQSDGINQTVSIRRYQSDGINQTVSIRRYQSDGINQTVSMVLHKCTPWTISRKHLLNQITYTWVDVQYPCIEPDNLHLSWCAISMYWTR